MNEIINREDLYLFQTGKARQAYLTFGCHYQLAEYLIKLLFQLSAFDRFLLRREHRGEVFQRDFPALKSHDFRFLFVSDSGTYKITFPFHAAASAASVPPVYPAGYGQPAAVNCPVRFSALPVPSYLSSCLFHWLLPLLPAFHFPLTGH